MTRLHGSYPVYGFDRHKGYSTRSHMRALASHGPCPQHRVSFANVQGLAGPGSSADVLMADGAPDGVTARGMSGPLMEGELTYG
jgi:ribonuclease HII